MAPQHAPIVRGVGAGSGSAHLVVAYALQHRGCTVLCTAPEPRLESMFAEVRSLLPSAVGVEIRSGLVAFSNLSRIMFRTPMRGGARFRGMLPSLVWADQLDQAGEAEIASILRPMGDRFWWYA